MTSNAIAANFISPAASRWLWPMAIGASLTALADWLFFRQQIGVSLPLFVLALGFGVLLTNRIEASRGARLLYLGILIAAVIPIVDDINVMSVLIAGIGIGAFALGVTAVLKGDLKDRLVAVGWFLVSGPFQVFQDLPLLSQWARERSAHTGLIVLKGWIVPLALGAIFVTLFAAANPLIANFLTQWNVRNSFSQLDLLRPVFWLVVIAAIWMFLCIGRRFALPDRNEIAAAADLPSIASFGPIFNDAVIGRSLVLFNLLFAMQSALDINYLWRGAELPDGMTYASYAHRGAYPLIVTALLAAAFVIVAMRPGSQAERSPMMRALVFLWVGQNMLLVASSILRLQLYVEAYSLTYWRVAAFIWMLVVAAGLVLIAARIMTHRSNAWLVSMNLATVALTMYACSFINFPNLVASYNVETGIASTGHSIDIGYIASLGPHAIPAIDRYIAAHSTPQPTALAHRNALAFSHNKRTEGWRAWTFRGWRLTRYLYLRDHVSSLTPP